MKKIIIGVAATTFIFGVLAVPAFAAQPASPGCFGTDRAAYATTNGSLGNNVGGVGYWASLRAGDNGTINQAYMLGCGGVPAN